MYQTKTNQSTKKVTEVEMEVSEDTKTERVPPVILRNAGVWTTLYAENCKTRKCSTKRQI